MTVSSPTSRSPGKLSVKNRHRLSHRMALPSPIKSTSSQRSGQLTREQIDALLEKLRDPSLARQFLMDAGLIDADGQLTRPYRSQDAQTA